MAKVQQPPKAKSGKGNRAACANKVVAAVKGKTTLSALAQEADAMFVQAGGTSKPKAAQVAVRRALETAASLGVVKLVRPTDMYVERV